MTQEELLEVEALFSPENNRKYGGGDLPAVDLGLAYQPPPLEVLPEVLRSFVQSHAEAIGVDPGYVLPSALVALAAAIGNAVQIELKLGWREPAVIWSAVVAESGTAKTPAMAKALEPLEESDAISGTQTLVKDVTVEALAPLLERNPRGLLVYRDELDGLLGSFDQYKGGRGSDTASWLELWNAHSLKVNRKSTEPISVAKAAVSVIGSVQPATLRCALGERHRNNGLAARFLWAMPPRRAKRWTDAVIPERVWAAFVGVSNQLSELDLNLDAYGRPQPRVVGLDGAASDVWSGFVNEWGTAGLQLESDRAAAHSKLEAYAARFALVLHLVQSDHLEPVTATAIEAGVALTRWFARESQRVYAYLDGDTKHVDDERILQWVRAAGDKARVEYLHRSGPQPWRGDPDRAVDDVERLVVEERLDWVLPPQLGPGRPRARRLVVVDNG